MVGKGETKSSRIFHQCYVKCCKLQNLTPLNTVIPSENGQVLDFCVDRIKYADWPPILNALSCDLSLHSVAIRCRQPVKTVLEHIDCERLAKTVNKRAVILTNFMLSNLAEAISQLLTNTTLLTSLLLEGLPLKIPYLNPLNTALLANSSLQHLYLPRCLIGDAGCLALCKAVRCLPNLLTLDLTACELTMLGASYIADLVKYQKIHRYSENWVHTLRYRLPDLDTMAGLRRITLCSNQELGDAGVSKLLEVLADDLWIKAVDLQNCGVTEATAAQCLNMLGSNTALVVLDLRHNAQVSNESLAEIRQRARANVRGNDTMFTWLNTVSGSTDRLIKTSMKNGMVRYRGPSATRSSPPKSAKPVMTGVKKEQTYPEDLSSRLQEEISHRRQLEQLNLSLVQQMKELKRQQMTLWTNGTGSSGSEQSLGASSRSYEMSSSSGSSSIPIDQNTLSYIQQAFKDIYAFIKNNQCHGQCQKEVTANTGDQYPTIQEVSEAVEYSEELRVNISAKKAQSAHLQLTEAVGAVRKVTKSAHLLGDEPRRDRDAIDVMPGMIERQMGDTNNTMFMENQNMIDNILTAQSKIKSASGARSPAESECSSAAAAAAPNPRDAMYSSSEDEGSL